MKLHILQLSFAQITAKEYLAIRNREVLKESTLEKLRIAETLDLKEIKAILDNNNIEFISMKSEYYPKLLKEIHDPPYILYVRGDKTVLQTPMLGIVGSRKAGTYTKKALGTIIPNLKNMTVVSGLAYGADDIAHTVALSNNIKTIGILAFGHNIHYPKSTRNTRNIIEERHCTISEFPPGTELAKYKFVSRNRIIAGMSYGVLVTEAEDNSGSLITLEMAIDENRHTFCVPGNITSPLSIGVNERIKEGATVVTDANDIYNELNIF